MVRRSLPSSIEDLKKDIPRIGDSPKTSNEIMAKRNGFIFTVVDGEADIIFTL